eukprot:TRINITY_DN4808_c0_g1_i13.p1 TRINITY_DN4808_c0_g1~~TRINITY_DN4808_c0_g1_i13.p1  ORF type:complete len:125 (+),score=25.75 TRINITY_DN4808_c0_g1_i13:25-375(+)
MIRRPPRSTRKESSAASDVYKRQVSTQSTWGKHVKELYRINLDLSEALKNANSRLLSLTRKGGSKARNRNGVAFTHSNDTNTVTGSQALIFEATRDLQPSDLLSPISKNSSVLNNN